MSFSCIATSKFLIKACARKDTPPRYQFTFTPQVPSLIKDNMKYLERSYDNDGDDDDDDYDDDDNNDDSAGSYDE